ncbi:DNA polymerase III subunit alpha [Mesobacillus maritimus]|uniref:DNA polymerase III subunit alpha n=1 Tax=Mesobacillus maritimus TaxID=1643336 RepID=A0ABS7K9S7_9BACI|nr:DNA polymerase III subunit alpha [Mesobacillus maritimus]MBY0099017.1 DNA polymerase III subunit alpha [Mesobacillus maritimus]
MSYLHLQVHSAYSLLTSTIKIDELVSSAKEKGFPAIALTDRNVMYGTIAFYKECLRNSIKPIIGLTVDILGIDEEKVGPLVLLASNNQGFQNLIKITSAVQTKSPEGIPVKWLRHYAAGVYAFTPGIEGEIEQSLLKGERERATQLANLFSEIFGKNHFFLSLQNQGVTGQVDLVEQIAALSGETGIQLVAANSVHYLKPEDSFAQECLLAMKNGHKLQDDDRSKLGSDQFYLKTSEEMIELFSEYPSALENTLKISEDCNVMIDLQTKHLPKYPVSEGQTADKLLEQLCFSGLTNRYPNPSNEHIRRLKYELSVIKKMKFSDYFLIVWDFMKFARDRGILTGPGRGSAAGSIVAYALYITDVDPIGHQLLFERFLNPERISMPDIDIDFPDHRRDEMIEYVANKYGELHVAQIITFGTLAAKAAARDVGRVFGLNTKELDRLSRLIPSRLGVTLDEAYKESDHLRKFVNESDLNQRLFQTAVKLEGLPRHTSTHAAGVVISERPLTDLIPIQTGHGNILLTQYSMEHLEEAGLLKMDFLGLRNLTLIESILTSIHRKTGQRVDIRKIPLEDKQTFELLSTGDTTGVFQLESEGMRKVLLRLKPSRFEDIVAVNALYRPGPMENIPLFTNRKHGIESIEYPHPDLKGILENTYGVIVYQEQIMQIASTLAGFSLGEADLLRRAVSKKKKVVLDKERTHFVEGALRKGYERETANQIYDLIVRFANYGFNRSHAVAYSFIAYQLAYLKAHYPLFFHAALMTSSIGNEAKISQYARELTYKGITLLPPSINKSQFSFQAEGKSIRYSLAAIKGVGAVALKEIFQVRKQKPFADLFDFCLRVPQKAINRKTMEALVHSGAFDEFGHDRATLLATLDVAAEHAQLMAPEDTGQFGLFFDNEFDLKPKYVTVDPLRVEDKLSFEKEVLGIYLSTHPISVKKKELTEAGARLMASYRAGEKARVGVYITDTKMIRTKKGEAMAFLTLSDPSGEIEAVAFPLVYKRSGHLLNQGEVVLLDGKMEERDGKSQFIIQNVLDIQMAIKEKRQRSATLFLKIDANDQKTDRLNELKEILKKHPGTIPVILHYAELEKTVLLSKEYKVNGTESCLNDLLIFLGEKKVVLKK